MCLYAVHKSMKYCYIVSADKSGEEKRRLLPSWGTADPKQLTHVDKTGLLNFVPFAPLLRIGFHKVHY